MLFLFRFYRLYISALLAIAAWYLLFHSVWPSIGVFVLVRLSWLAIEHLVATRVAARAFRVHAPRFKQEFGPYGIRLVNKAETDPFTRYRLDEVFTPSRRKLRESVEQLETLNKLFDAGLTPSGDEHILHDLCLKYGRARLAKEGK